MTSSLEMGGLFSKEKISRGGDEQEKREEKKDKWGSI